LEEQAAEAIVQGDTLVLGEMLDTSYVLSTSASVPLDRAAFLRELIARQRRLRHVDLGWRRLRVYDNAAVITGEVTLRGDRDRVPFAAVLRYTSFYVRSHARWRAVGTQVTVGEFDPRGD
jgi:hypothetical protein